MRLESSSPLSDLWRVLLIGGAWLRLEATSSWICSSTIFYCLLMSGGVLRRRVILLSHKASCRLFVRFAVGTTRSSLNGALVVVSGSVVWRSGTPSIGVCGYDMDIISESSMASSHSVFVELPTCPPLCLCAQLRRRWWFALLNRLRPSLGSSSAALYVPCVDSVPFGNPVSILVLRVCPRPCICLLLSLRLVESRCCYGLSSSSQFRSLWLACFLRWMDSSGLLRRSGMSKWSFCCLQNLFVGLWRKPSRWASPNKCSISVWWRSSSLAWLSVCECGCSEVHLELFFVESIIKSISSGMPNFTGFCISQ